jgi:DNA-binding NtrC family response regulator
MSETTELAAETLHLQRTARIVGDPRILIIDDEAAIRESLDTLLTLEGFTVSVAGDGPSGLELLSRNEYDLLLLDLALPGESGLDLLPRIVEMQPNLPVIMITAYGTVGNVVDAIRAGAENFVQKPWDNEKLLADIRAAVARHNSSALSSSATTSRTSSAKANRCFASSTSSRRSLPAAQPSSSRARAAQEKN